MSDTQRSQAALLTLLADNTTRAITPQTSRDVLVSVLGGYASILVSSAAAAQTGIGTGAVDLANWAANGPSSGITPLFSTGKLQVAVDGTYWLTFHASFTGTASRAFTFTVDVGGSPALGLAAQRKMDASGSMTGVSFSGPVTLTAGAQVKIQVSADQSASSLTLQYATFAAKIIG